jgi:hypothetical protein
MAQQQLHKRANGRALRERQIDQAETFLDALDSESLLSMKIEYKHIVEYDYAVYDHISEDLLETDVLKRYLRKRMAAKLRQLKQENGSH